MSQNNADDKFTQKNEEMIIFITLHSSQPHKYEVTSIMIQQDFNPFSTQHT